MRIKSIFLAGSLSLVTLGAFAQNIAPGALGYYNDALRFSQTRFGGTARFQGIAGANTALGGDASAAFINPAGLGMLRKSEMTFSFAANSANSNSRFLGETVNAGNLNLNLNHLGIHFSSDRGAESTVRGSTFAITMTRNNDFQELINYSGTNDRNSIVDYFLDRTDGRVPWSELDDELRNGIFSLEGLAYATYLINPFFGDNTTRNSYESFVPLSPTLQAENIRRSGAQSQWNLAYGLNIKDKFYLGAGIGIATLRYAQDKRYTENVLNSTTPLPGGQRLPLNNLELTEQNRQRGTGINANLGIIIRPTDFVRFGASITTPTIYRITDIYEAELTVQYNNFPFTEFQNGQPIIRVLSNERARTNVIESRYTMRTPMRINAGAAFILGKRGFVTADVEMVDYTTARFSNPNPEFSFAGDNATIASIYRNAINLRLGAEARFGDYRVRGGFAHQQNPMQDTRDNRSRNFITFGGGYRKSDFFLDAAVITSFFDSEYRVYRLPQNEPVVNINSSRVGLMVTAGFSI
ncbi:OmpP1/FadL family transporter [Rhodoflexus sp.]